MKDAVEDHNAMFGIFAVKPEKVMVLPGLVTVFDQFIQSVKKHKKSIRESNSVHLPHEQPKEDLKQNKKTGIPSINLADLPSLDVAQKKLIHWMENQKFNQGFRFEETSKKTTFRFICGGCVWKSNVSVYQNGKISLSNAQRHYKSGQCQKRKTSKSDSSAPFNSFFKKKR